MTEKEVVRILQVKEYLNNPENMNELRKSIAILRLIDEMCKKNKPPTTTDLVKEFYHREYDNAENNQKGQIFIRRRMPFISKLLRSLKKNKPALVEEYSLDGKLKSRSMRPTSLGYAILNLPDIDKVLEERIIIKDNDLEKRKQFHSNQIRNVIDKIIAELEDTRYNKFMDERMNIFSKSMALEYPAFIKDSLYPDLKFHLKKFITYKQFEEKFEKYQNMHEGYIIKRTKMIESIILLVKRDMQLEWENKSETDQFNQNLIDFIINGMEYLMMEDEKSYKYYFIDFKDHSEYDVNKENKPFPLRINGSVIANIYRKNYMINDHDKIIQNLKDMMISLEKKPCYEIYKEFISNKDDMYKILEEMISGLRKEREIAIYPGICKYIK